MYHFCTLFDSGYLTRGLALYESLEKYCESFHLYIFPFDDKCLEVLRKMKLPHATIIAPQDFEDSELKKVKPTRSRGEYCFTCTPSIILYVLENFKVDMVTYLDADIYFFSSPKVLIDELGLNSVSITEHRFAPEHDRTETSGKYNVQFLSFKNNKEGLEVANWWRNACLECCELNTNQGKCGDQKYLDDWTTRFQGVYELQNLGGGVAPWNVSQYYIFKNSEKIYGRVINSHHQFELVFYHFHAVKIYLNDYYQLTNSNYYLDKQVIKLIYIPYLYHLKDIRQKIFKLDQSFNPNGSSQSYLPTASDKFFKRMIFRFIVNCFTFKKKTNHNTIYHESGLRKFC
jgi:hypothetical protein